MMAMLTSDDIKRPRLVFYTLFELQISSCTCLTKTPDAELHDEKCKYRKINEAMTALRGIIQDLEK